MIQERQYLYGQRFTHYIFSFEIDKFSEQCIESPVVTIDDKLVNFQAAGYFASSKNVTHTAWFYVYGNGQNTRELQWQTNCPIKSSVLYAVPVGENWTNAAINTREVALNSVPQNQSIILDFEYDFSNISRTQKELQSLLDISIFHLLQNIDPEEEAKMTHLLFLPERVFTPGYWRASQTIYSDTDFFEDRDWTAVPNVEYQFRELLDVEKNVYSPALYVLTAADFTPIMIGTSEQNSVEVLNLVYAEIENELVLIGVSDTHAILQHDFRELN